MIVNHWLSSQTAPAPPILEAWQVYGQFLDEKGNPFTMPGCTDIAIKPQNPTPSLDGSFTFYVTSSPNANNAQTLPELDLSHQDYVPAEIQLKNIDLQNSGDDGAATRQTKLQLNAPYGDVTVTRTGNIIQLSQIKLQQNAPYNPTQPLVPVDANSSPPEQKP